MNSFEALTPRPSRKLLYFNYISLGALLVFSCVASERLFVDGEIKFCEQLKLYKCGGGLLKFCCVMKGGQSFWIVG